MILKDTFLSTMREFQQAWGSQDPESKEKVIKYIQDAASSSTYGTTAAMSTAIIPYK